MLALLSLTASILEGMGIMLFLPLIGTIFEIENDNTEINESYYLDIFSNDPSIIILLISTFFILKGIMVFGMLAYSSILRANLLKFISNTLLNVIAQAEYKYVSLKDAGYFINIGNEQCLRSLDAFRSLVHFLRNLLIVLF